MSYQPYNRNTSGIVFFGEQGNQQTFYSDTNFLIEDGAAGNIQAPNLKISDGGNIGSVSDPDSIAIAGNGNVTMSQSLSITGDLTVNGTTTTVNSTVVTIEDPIVIIGTDSSSAQYGSSTDDNKDRGIAFFWNDGGSTPQIGFFGHDDSRRGFVYATSGTMDAASGTFTATELGWGVFAGISGALAGNADTATEATNVTVTANNATNETVYLTFVDGATGTQGIETDTALNYNPSTDTLTAGTFAGNLTGDVTGNADTSTTLAEARFIGVSGQVVGSGEFDGSADVVVNTDLTVEAILDQTAESSPDNDDLILIYDNTAGALRRQTRGQFVSGLGAGSMDSFTVTADAGTNETINDGNTLDIAGGSGIQTVVGATDTVTINMKIDQSTLGFTTDILEVQDGGITETQLNTSVAGVGLAGGGGTALSVDLSEFSAVTLASGDSFATLDSDGSTEQRTTIMDLGAYLAGGTDSNITVNGSCQLFVTGGTTFTISGDTGSETVGDGDTITFAGSTGLDVAVTATDTVTYTIDISQYSTVAVAASDSFMVLDSDGSTHQRATIDQLGTYLAGDNITNTAGVLSVADSDIEAAIFTDANFVDGTTVNFTVTAGASVTAEVQDIATTNIAAGTLVVESEGIGSNDNDTTIPTSAAVKDYVDNDARLAVVTDNTSSTLGVDDDVSLVTAGSNLIITLPAESTVGSGKVVTVKKIDNSSNTVTVQGNTGNVDGGTYILYSENESVTVVCNGTNWFVI